MVRLCLVLLLAAAPLAFSQARVRVWANTLSLPTYAEGLPDPNPPFDQFQQPLNLPFVYPYTIRTSFTKDRSVQEWRALNLENEYLRCVILPDLGGHVYDCTDKITGRGMFFANSSIKKEWIALRGSWAAFGLESNFPNGHSWVSVSSVDFATRENEDGSASVWVGNVDRVTGMQWRCEFVLRPGIAVLEQRVTLENRSDVRRRYYWWSNAAVRIESEKDRFVVPAHVASAHGSGVIETWPVNASGKDLSVLDSYTQGDGFFAIGSREEFLGIYQPQSKSGLLHIASPVDVPGKKTWTWGPDPWHRINLSDDNSGYIEIQGGATPSQDIYEYLEPQQIRSFTEYWAPVRFVGGISRANTTAVLHLARGSDGAVTGEVVPAKPLTDATLELAQGDQILQKSEPLALVPERMATLKGLPATPNPAPVTFRLRDSGGAVLLEYTEGKLDALLPSEVQLGRQPIPSWLQADPTTEAGFLDLSDYNERFAQYDFALGDYARGLNLFPESPRLSKGLGRLLQILGNPDAPVHLAKAGTEPETQYYSALSARNGALLKEQRQDTTYGMAASIRAAEMDAAAGDMEAALATIRASLDAARSRPIRAGAIEVALLRALGRWDEAATRFAAWRNIDPTDSLLRYEGYRLNLDDGTFWSHLAADAERVLNVAEHLMRLGQFADALEVLEWQYEPVSALQLEPGIPAPAKHPLIWYYRGYVKQKTGSSGGTEFRIAAELPVRYVFPNRALSLEVLDAALQFAPEDANAHWLRGCTLFSMRRTREAIAAWERVRALRPSTPSLHRTLGRVWLDVRKDKATARPILEEGLRFEPDNADLKDAIRRAQ